VNILLLSFSLQSITAPDKWFAADKAKHFFMGSFIQSASFGVLTAAGVDKGPALTAASGMTLTVTIGKEIRDRRGRGTASGKDVAWGLAGAAAISPVLARTK
jgi:uncharacterized protein YfiM (DUF2279 family)